MDEEQTMEELKENVRNLQRTVLNLEKDMDLYLYRLNTHKHLGSDLTKELFTLGTQTVYASGTAYSLTNTAALLNFGTTDPTLTITAAGTYLILGRVRLDYNAATFAASRTVTLKYRRTNNTAADLTGGTTAYKTDIITTKTYTMGTIPMPPIIYTTTNTNDIVQIFGSVDTVPSAGSLDAAEAEIVVIRLTDL